MNDANARRRSHMAYETQREFKRRFGRGMTDADFASPEMQEVFRAVGSNDGRSVRHIFDAAWAGQNA